MMNLVKSMKDTVKLDITMSRIHRRRRTICLRIWILYSSAYSTQDILGACSNHLKLQIHFKLRAARLPCTNIQTVPMTKVKKAPDQWNLWMTSAPSTSREVPLLKCSGLSMLWKLAMRTRPAAEREPSSRELRFSRRRVLQTHRVHSSQGTYTELGKKVGLRLCDMS